MKIIKCIRTVYPVGRNAQLITHFVYDRMPYQGYGMLANDEIDLNIFAVIDKGSKRLVDGTSQTHWYRSELD